MIDAAESLAVGIDELFRQLTSRTIDVVLQRAEVEPCPVRERCLVQDF